jgi:hypothetical protein
MENWKEIDGYDGMYQVSDLGNIKSFHFNMETIMKPRPNVKGYLYVNLSKDGAWKTKYIHKLVAIAYLGHVPDGMNSVINHINFIKDDNRAVNLEITTNRDNSNRKHIQHTSQYTGVHWMKTKKRWRALIVVNGKQKYLGQFKSELDASEAYQKELLTINNS